MERRKSDYSSSSSSSSSWSADEQQLADETSGAPSVETISLDSPYKPSNSSSPDKSIDNDVDDVPADQERQILLLMLLAQVCALHDPTPRTFTVHVLELFERGILDRQSIHFLYDLNLVPAVSPPRPLALTETGEEANGTNNQQLAVGSNNYARFPQRSAEVSAIRSTLERVEYQRLVEQAGKSSTLPQQLPHDISAALHPKELLQHQSSFAADLYPLSLSRYQREFFQKSLLASGSFGQVFCATHKMDGCDYAVKRVAFQASGFSTESVQQVIRETQCLALCDHPNVVRYYTSWLEPSWMTGTGSAEERDPPTNRLLTNVQKLVSGDGLSDDLTDDFRDYFKMSDLSLKKTRRFSFSDSLNVGDEDSAWTIEVEHSRDDSYLDGRRPSVTGHKQQQAANKPAAYSYQICLFIQMELCKSHTLADWIRDRNHQVSGNSVAERIEAVVLIFEQLVRGLAHIHEQNVIHRDLKPANIFASHRPYNEDDTLQFKLGDFGLSTLLRSSSNLAGEASQIVRYNNSLSTANPACPVLVPERDTVDSAWLDPLTAGVGTASYAAPEQVASRDYGTEADIFSLGLILLELLCCFSTEHERLLIFSDCRHRRAVPTDLDACATAKLTILKCTDPDPSKRPRARELIGIDLLKGLLPPVGPTYVGSTLAEMNRQLEDKDATIANLTSELQAKQRLIDDLYTQVRSLKDAKSDRRARNTFMMSVAPEDSGSGFDSASTSSNTSSDYEL